MRGRLAAGVPLGRHQVLDPAPIIALNRGIPVAEIDGPAVALAAVDCFENMLAGHRARGQHRRDCLPDTPPQPARVVRSEGAAHPALARRL